MSKKVGIITFHEALNYGAVLQAYALKAVCEDMGCEAHIVDYHYGGIEEKVAPMAKFLAAPSKKAALPGLLRGLLGYLGDKKREYAFAAFRKNYLSETAPCGSAADISALGYDVLIAGSDQIWNRGVTQKRYDPVFFMNFLTDAEKVLYGASSEDVPFSGEKEASFLDALKDLQGTVSIREKRLADYVQSLTGKQYPVVLDPTLLAGRERMERIATPAPPKGRYILLYQIDANPASDISVRSLEARFSCPVYTMMVPRLDNFHGRKGEAGPEEFLALLKGAEFLVTNSFHGIALSILFEKNFYVYENGGVMSRIDGLLTQAGLTDRKVKMVVDIDLEQKIDYAAVASRMEVARAASVTFLTEALMEKAPVPELSGSKETVSRKQKKECCGCTACAEICPAAAITMELDVEGFLYPKVDESKCIRCGKCQQVCGFHPFPVREELYTAPKAFGVKHIDLPTRLSSRSGAAFVAFSDDVLKKGGVIYGVSMGQDFTVSHIRAVAAEDRDRMKGAKYVQSDIRGIYPQVAQDLRDGRHVLFSGTPCQVAGLRCYLQQTRVNHEKLCCCDIICHGVPSPAIWRDYLAMIGQTHKKKILSANFRDKELGWDSQFESVLLEGEKKKRILCGYSDLFCRNIMQRPSCALCPFANLQRPGDLTMGDFWGIEKHDPVFNDNCGVSLVLVNSSTGAAIFRDAQNDLICFEADVKGCLQPNLISPTPASPERDAFWKDYQTMPFPWLLRKYTRPMTVSDQLKKWLKKILYRLGIRRHP